MPRDGYGNGIDNKAIPPSLSSPPTGVSESLRNAALSSPEAQPTAETPIWHKLASRKTEIGEEVARSRDDEGEEVHIRGHVNTGIGRGLKRNVKINIPRGGGDEKVGLIRMETARWPERISSSGGWKTQTWQTPREKMETVCNADGGVQGPRPRTTERVKCDDDVQGLRETRQNMDDTSERDEGREKDACGVRSMGKSQASELLDSLDNSVAVL